MSTKLERFQFISVVTSTPPDEEPTRRRTRSLAVARPVARTLTQSILQRKDVPVAFLLVERKPNYSHHDVPFEKLVNDAFFRTLNQRSNQSPNLRLMEAVAECDQVVREVFRKSRWRNMVREEVTLIAGIFSAGELVIARLGRASALLYRNGRMFTLLPEQSGNPLEQSSELGRPIPAKIETCSFRIQKDDRLLFWGNDEPLNEPDQIHALGLLTCPIETTKTFIGSLSNSREARLILLVLENYPASGISNPISTEPVFKKEVVSHRPTHFPGVPPEYYGEMPKLAELPPITFRSAKLMLKPAVGSRPMLYRYRMNHAGLLVWSGDLNRQDSQSTTPSKATVFAVAVGYSSPELNGAGIERFDGFLGSHLALEFFLNTFLQTGVAEPTLEAVRDAFIQAGSELRNFNLRNGTEVAASLTVAVVRDSKVLIAHAGATSAVLLRKNPENPHVIVLAHPQTVAHRLISEGIEIPQGLSFNPHTSPYNAMTQQGDFEVEVGSWNIQPDDRLVLSTLEPEYFKSEEVISLPSALALGAEFKNDETILEDVALIAVDIEEEGMTS